LQRVPLKQPPSDTKTRMERHNMERIFYWLLAFSLLPSLSWAIEPMNEDALGGFSLDSGQSFLQVYGPTVSGIRVEAVGKEQAPPPTRTPDRTNEQSAKLSIKKIEEKLTESFQRSASERIIDPDLASLGNQDQKVVGRAATHDVSSEIRYDKKKFKHSPTFNDDGSVLHERSLHVDLLKFEDIGNNDPNDSSSFGDVFISDWSSIGSTRTQVK